MRIGVYSTGLCIPVFDGYVSIDNLLEIEAVRAEGLNKVVIALKKKYHMDEVDESTVPDHVRYKMGFMVEATPELYEEILPKIPKAEKVKTCKKCEKVFVYKNHLELYCDPCKTKRKK